MRIFSPICLLKGYHPNHHQYWEEIAAEIQYALVRTPLLPYSAADVCDKLKIPYNKQDTISGIETNILLKILKDSLEKMTDEEKAELTKSVGMDNIADLTPQTILLGVQAISVEVASNPIR